MLLSCKEVSFSYINSLDQNNLILDNISLEIAEGETVLLTGESGAGKTTLLHILGQILQPTKGKIICNGSISFIFQNYHLISALNTQENIAIAQVIKNNTSWKQAMKLAHTILEKVELEHRAEHSISQLSGGEKQRVAIARALITTPKILLCDEPTGNLDDKRSDIVLKLILELAKQNNTCVLFITHNTSLHPYFHKHFHLSKQKLNKSEYNL